MVGESQMAPSFRFGFEGKCRSDEQCFNQRGRQFALANPIPRSNIGDAKKSARERARLHSRDRGRIPDHRPGDTRVAVAYSTVSGGRQNAAERTCQTRDASIGRRTRHGDCADAACARQQVIELRSELATLASRDGLKTASASKLFAALVHKSEITRGRNAARSALRTARMSITSWVSAPATGLK
jgi:hypothetical protein